MKYDPREWAPAWRRCQQTANKRRQRARDPWGNRLDRIRVNHNRRFRSAPSEYLSRGALRDLLVAQNFRCALTGELLTPDTISLDHIQPIHLGKPGTDTIGNCQLVTRAANAAKGGLAPDEFLRLCRAVAKHAGRAKRKKKRPARRYRQKTRAKSAGR